MKAVCMLVPCVLCQRFGFCTRHRSGPVIKVFSQICTRLLWRNVPSLFCWSAIQSPTRFHQEQIWFHSYHPDSQGVGSFSLNNRTSSFCNSWAPSLTAPTYPAPSLSSKNGEEVNHIIILGSINYVNFVGNNIKYGNSPSPFLNPLHFLTSVTPIVERIQLQRHLGNVIMLIYCL